MLSLGSRISRFRAGECRGTFPKLHAIGLGGFRVYPCSCVSAALPDLLMKKHCGTGNNSAIVVVGGKKHNESETCT